jgi:predicted dithiol-disulfide oxidoreductase (DUF899 family)
MKYATGSDMIRGYRREISELHKRIRSAQADTEPEAVSDYTFQTPAGTVRLAELFGSHQDLIVVHNMGNTCPGCTLWADGFNGIYHHIVTRAAFAISSPDSPAVQQAFAASRGWKFPMVSHQGSNFAADMGYRSPEGRFRPGISTFRRVGERIERVADAEAGPGDDFCTLWHLFDLLPGGATGWSPKINYA